MAAAGSPFLVSPQATLLIFCFRSCSEQQHIQLFYPVEKFYLALLFEEFICNQLKLFLVFERLILLYLFFVLSLAMQQRRIQT